jgi:hypothetical protein
MNVQTILANVKKAEAKISAAEKASEAVLLAAYKAIKAMPCKTFKDIDARENAVDTLMWETNVYMSDACCRVRDAITKENDRAEDRILDREDREYRAKVAAGIIKPRKKKGGGKGRCGRGR